MRVIDSTENSPSAELEAKIHQCHRGLTAVMLRRRGRAAFKSIQLEGKDGSSVGHREPPTDKPADIASKAWEALTEHASRTGSGSYEVELVFATGEKGPAPKAVIIPLAVGEDTPDLGNGTDPGVIVDLALRLCNFTMVSLRGVLNELPNMAAATTANMVELRKLGEAMLESIRTASSSSDAVEIAKLEAKANADRIAFAREFMGPGMSMLKDAMVGGGGSSSLRAAAATKAISSSAEPVDERVAKLQADVVEAGRIFARSLTDSQLVQIAHVIGEPLVERVKKMRDASTHSDVLLVIADIVDLGKERVLPLLALLTNEQGECVDKLQTLSDELKKPTTKPAAAEATS